MGKKIEQSYVGRKLKNCNIENTNDQGFLYGKKTARISKYGQTDMVQRRDHIFKPANHD